jgi:K+-transporting ATPase ATPase C chain
LQIVYPLAITGISKLAFRGEADGSLIEKGGKSLHDADPDNRRAIPVDLVTASGSGLDPQISVAAARYQAARVADVSGCRRGAPGGWYTDPLDQVIHESA